MRGLISALRSRLLPRPASAAERRPAQSEVARDAAAMGTKSPASGLLSPAATRSATLPSCAFPLQLFTFLNLLVLLPLLLPLPATDCATAPLGPAQLAAHPVGGEPDLPDPNTLNVSILKGNRDAVVVCSQALHDAFPVFRRSRPRAQRHCAWLWWLRRGRVLQGHRSEQDDVHQLSQGRVCTDDGRLRLDGIPHLTFFVDRDQNGKD